MLAYIACRGFKPGPVYCHTTGKYLTRQQLVTRLKALLSEAGVECNSFLHVISFCIGTATMAANGVTDSRTPRFKAR